MAGPPLVRDVDNAMLGGVCAGIAQRYAFDPTVVRLLWLLLGVVSLGLGVVLYVAAWIVMPRPDQVPPPPEEPQGATAPEGESDEGTLTPGERLSESARTLLRATRTTAEEIADIARGRPPAADGADAEPPAPSTDAAERESDAPDGDGEPRPPTTGGPAA